MLSNKYFSINDTYNSLYNTLKTSFPPFIREAHSSKKTHLGLGMGWFAFQVIGKITRRNNISYWFSIMQGDKEIHKVCGAIFQHGEVAVGGLKPYRTHCEVPPLPDLRKTGNQSEFFIILLVCVRTIFWSLRKTA